MTHKYRGGCTSMPNDAMASVGGNLASFGIGMLRENFRGFRKL